MFCGSSVDGLLDIYMLKLRNLFIHFDMERFLTGAMQMFRDIQDNIWQSLKVNWFNGLMGSAPFASKDCGLAISI